MVVQEFIRFLGELAKGAWATVCGAAAAASSVLACYTLPCVMASIRRIAAAVWEILCGEDRAPKTVFAKRFRPLA
jgi:hypothetical protein